MEKSFRLTRGRELYVEIRVDYEEISESEENPACIGNEEEPRHQLLLGQRCRESINFLLLLLLLLFLRHDHLHSRLQGGSK